MSEDKLPIGFIADYKPAMLTAGILGAEGANIGALEANRLLEIERRILGIEESLRARAIPILRADDPEHPAWPT